jgi:hypothetical protein
MRDVLPEIERRMLADTPTSCDCGGPRPACKGQGRNLEAGRSHGAQGHKLRQTAASARPRTSVAPPAAPRRDDREGRDIAGNSGG